MSTRRSFFDCISHNVCQSVSKIARKVYHFLISRVRTMIIRIQLSFDPMNPGTSLLIEYSTSISHNVCLSVSKRHATFSSLESGPWFFALQLSFDQMNHRTSLLIEYSTSISHNVRPSWKRLKKRYTFLALYLFFHPMNFRAWVE